MVLQVIEYPDSLRLVCQILKSDYSSTTNSEKKIKVIVIDLVSFKTEVRQDFFSTELKLSKATIYVAFA